jgi:uncharacterized surface protein with fasciclin (FAS1) repeats
MQDILSTVNAHSTFKTLTAAINATDLSETLNGYGTYTVFAPSDAAFAKLPPGTVEGLVKPENKAKLTALLRFHMMSGGVLEAEAKGKKLSQASLNGQTIHVDGENGLSVNGIQISKKDIACTNGVIHIIDTVMMPKG